MPLVHPCYFAPIAQYAVLYNENNIVFEVCDNFQKQTYRNRCYIAGPNGKQLLNIPVIKDKASPKILTRDVRIDYSSPWYKNHLKSLHTAYSSAPYFEYYIDEITTILSKEHEFLLDLNFEIHNFVMEVLQENVKFTKSIEYNSKPSEKDFRYLVNAKKEIIKAYPSYFQLFESKNGSLKNLSILDLIFMEGTAAFNFLIKVKKNLQVI